MRERRFNDDDSLESWYIQLQTLEFRVYTLHQIYHIIVQGIWSCNIDFFPHCTGNYFRLTCNWLINPSGLYVWLLLFLRQVPHTVFCPPCPLTQKAAAPSVVLVCIITKETCYVVCMYCMFCVINLKFRKLVFYFAFALKPHTFPRTLPCLSFPSLTKVQMTQLCYVNLQKSPMLNQSWT